ncbi:MAG: glycosyltransferase family 1 protein [bacterium]|nr:glycosyltransferase family 1 protein [Candidatus Sumerlaeota bacterium]
MRILIDARYLRAQFSGIGTYSRNLIEALAREDVVNDYIVLTHSSYHDRPELGPNFQVVTDDALPVSLRSVTTLKSAISRHQPDVLHSLFPLVPLTWSKKLVVTVHDLQPLLDPKFTSLRGAFKRSLYDMFYRITYPAALRKADCLMSVSYATTQSIVDMFPDCAGKILVVHGGVNEQDFEVPPSGLIGRVREKYDIPQRFIFYIGSTRPNKNLPAMLDAFELFLRMRPEHKDVYWVLVVKPDRFFDPFFAQVRERGLLKHIQIHQQVSEQDKRVFYHLASMLYMVTKFEGFGLPVLEAQAQDLPVMVSTHGSLPEVAGVSALMCDPDDPVNIAQALCNFFDNPSLTPRMVELGRENVKRFTWPKTAREVINIYNHLLA